ncbi:MAG: rRNA pseudouridine synthase, partial [Bacteroidetes bacterium]|nr:rRNA pseudouridine synthase [Bacteroidota bacterium]
MPQTPSKPDLIRLNKFIANAGICSRREADDLIQAGFITVNGKKTTQLGTKVAFKDTIEYKGKKITAEKKVYLLLNKPKGFISTVKDTSGRNTIMSLVKHATDERIYPVGRLDKDTTGLLVMTNDGELTLKLSHPSSEIKKIYHVVLERELLPGDLETIRKGVDLEDGHLKVDAIEFLEGESRAHIGIELHSGRNRIIRRLFEKLNHTVVKLDRVGYAGLTKRSV